MAITIIGMIMVTKAIINIITAMIMMTPVMMMMIIATVMKI